MDRGAIQAVVEQIKKESFVAGHNATDSEAMGLLVAHFFQWDGVAILRTAQYALEDANFHDESAKVAEMANIWTPIS